MHHETDEIEEAEDRGLGHLLLELGFDTWPEGDEQLGAGPVAPEMCVPGTDSLRTSILAAWTDTMAGYLAVAALAPRVPVTLELSVHLYGEPAGLTAVRATSRILKRGRAVVVATVDFEGDDGRRIATGHASFVAAPDTTLTLMTLPRGFTSEPTLRVPFAERAGCMRLPDGRASLARSPDGLNSSNTVNGGLIALVAEEAALSATAARGVSHLALRYLRPVRVGPAVATAWAHGPVADVEVHDAGRDDVLAVIATAHLFEG
jgi:acyl-coenzyme A thioesterase PaaI-like protein